MSLGRLWIFFNDYQIVFGVLLVAVGGYLLIYGGKYHEQTMFLFGEIVVSTFFLLVLFAFVYPPNSPEWMIWLNILICLGLGALAGKVTQKYARFGVLLIGAIIGVMVGTVLFSGIVSKLATANPMLWLWFTIILSCVGVGYLSITYFDYAVIAGSSVIGAYIFIRGVSIFLGGFPNEFILYQNYKNGAVGAVQKTFFIYFLAMLFIAFTSFGIQMKMRSGNESQYSVRKEAKYSKV